MFYKGVGFFIIFFYHLDNFRQKKSKMVKIFKYVLINNEVWLMKIFFSKRQFRQKFYKQPVLIKNIFSFTSKKL